jgi:anaerobic dimethyl sulfoxide reductase subunit A
MKKESSVPETKTIPVSCNKDCAAGCPLLAHVEDGKIVKITNNPDGTPYMQGCSKGFQAMQVAYAPDRLLEPLIRTGPRGSGDFKKVPWDEALDYVAAELRTIKEKFGSESILYLGGSGSCRGALHNTASLTPRFLNLFGGYKQTYSNYSCAASDFVTPYVFGTMEVGIDAATLQHSKLIILWGANIMDTRFGCEYPTRIREAGKNGVPIIVIDPRKSRTANLSNAEWVQIRPGTDTADRPKNPTIPEYCWPDAKKRGLHDAHKVMVRSHGGKMQISVMITEDIMPGVVCLLQGIWPCLDEKGMDHAGATNMLTSTVPTEPCKGSRTHSVLVEVESCEG